MDRLGTDEFKGELKMTKSLKSGTFEAEPDALQLTSFTNSNMGRGTHTNTLV